MPPGRNQKSQRRPNAQKRIGTDRISDSLDSEEVFERGVEQEEQGERYQFGEKARVRFENSIKHYERSIELELGSVEPDPKRLFDRHFNCARVLVHYAQTFAPGRMACVEFIQNGIRHYRESVSLGEEPTDLIDAHFNLASSLSTLGDMISAGAIPPSPEYVGQAEVCWEEAKGEFIRTFELQTSLSSEQAGHHPKLDTQTNAEAEKEVAGDEGIGGEDIEVKEFFSITPSVMIDTLLALIDVLLTLLPTQANNSRVQIDHYLQKVLELNTLAESSLVPTRKFEIENLMINVELSLIENEFSEVIKDSTPPVRSLTDIEAQMQTILTRLENLSNNYNGSAEDLQDLVVLANNYSLLCSTYSLIQFRLQVPIDAERLKTLLLKTRSLHSVILSRLRSHRIRPIQHLLPHETTPLISSSLIGQAEVHLLLHTLSYPHLTAPTPYQNAFGLVLEAYNETKGPYSLSPVLLTNFPIRLQVVPSPIADRREDWLCLSPRLEAVKLMIRAKWLLTDLNDSASEEDVEKLVRAEVVPMLKKFEISRADVVRYAEESEDDAIWCMTAGREGRMWRWLLRM
ncbi:hypothetical protein CROQUDRAFT_650857 [Cronartium quercuum f. sp. fusiforme G11]|uniref:Uncharacterized protein n=1 Tax=Cronartium quercuum f. sp. fusiforme G11 TaxID=708437 RepID=A0A9P6NX51_9BASI|nr:hypothetical protein CROQUDRAFT_650857 [Cronartium quercuum f. sp. fusiforme G11]